MRHTFSQSWCWCAVMLVNTSDVLLRLLLMKHSDVAYILIIHMKHSNSVSAAVSSEHTPAHTQRYALFQPGLTHCMPSRPDAGYFWRSWQCRVSKDLPSPSHTADKPVKLKTSLLWAIYIHWWRPGVMTILSRNVFLIVLYEDTQIQNTRSHWKQHLKTNCT